LLQSLEDCEAERSRIARVLHDDVSQVLSAIGLQLDVLRMDYQERDPEIASRTAEVQQLLEQAIDRVRGLGRDLNPSIVDRAGLQFALTRLVGRIRESYPAPIRLLYDPAARLPQEIARTFYRIAEDALDNAARHAHGAPVEILVRPTRDGITLEVRDEGPGFQLDQARRQSGGLGLLLMERRAVRAGVEFSVSTSPGRGTIVKAIFKVPDAV
jgi:two-component system NarL family sensor kinase